MLFSYCRTRWPLLFAPRTKLKGKSYYEFALAYPGLTFLLGFSPHEAHAHQAFFGWIMPTIRTSELTVLQIVGLDAAVVCALPSLRGSLSKSIHYHPAPQFLQDCISTLLSMLAICYHYPNASQLEGDSIVDAIG